MSKTFYIETFGCQMNVHDSEKVIGTLQQHGYAQVDDAEMATLVLYNTCSIREKAAQKVFNRLNDLKRLKPEWREGVGWLMPQKYGVLGCVAQQEGEAIFDAAPHVSLVAGSASYSKLPELIARLEAGEERVTGLSLDTEVTFDTPYTSRDNPHRAYITIIEGCDKHCAYCVVPFTRGPERSRTSASVIEEARRIADSGVTEIQLLGQNVNSYRDTSAARVSFAELMMKVADVAGIRRVRFTTSHPLDFGRDIVEAIAAHPGLCNHVHLPAQSGSSDVLRGMKRDYTREQYLERISWIKQGWIKDATHKDAAHASPLNAAGGLNAAGRRISLSTDIIVGFPGETEADFEQTITLLDEVGYDLIYSFQFSPRPNTAALAYADVIPDAVKALRLRIVQDRQRQIQLDLYQRFVGTLMEVQIEGVHGKPAASGAKLWKGRTAENLILNFTVPPEYAQVPAAGQYWNTRVTQVTATSLQGEAVGAPVFIQKTRATANPDEYFLAHEHAHHQEPPAASPFQIL